MKKLLLCLLFPLVLVACNNDDDNPDPAKTTEPSIIGKWDGKTGTRQNFTANGQPGSTTTKPIEPGQQFEFLANNVWHQYDRYQIVDNGRYKRTGKTIDINIHLQNTVSDSLLVRFYIKSLTEHELILRDTLVNSDKTYSVGETTFSR